jgi:molybdenum cofactor cytidylyltransferase
VLGHRAVELQARLSGWPLVFAFNDEPGGEMGVSIARGVEELPPEAKAALIMPADLPAVPPEVIRAVIEAWEKGAKLVIPEYAGRGGHPVLVSLDFREELLKLDTERGLRGLFDKRREEVRRVPVASPYIRCDLDTWEDYCALHEEIYGLPPPSNGAA